MFRFLFAFLLLVAAPLAARSETAQEAAAERLYVLIKAQDIPAIGAMLAQARKDDLSGPTEFTEQRNLFTVFSYSDPAIDRFTENWVKQAPDDANALAARASYLLSMGWNYRGEEAAYRVPPENMRRMSRMHRDAFRLAERAASLAPDLAAASDVMIAAARTISRRKEGFAEFQRFMALHPNRGSLMREAFSLSPQWGGGIEYVNALCGTYAKQIVSVSDYSFQTCVADAVYFAYFPEGPDKTAALDVLVASTNPVLNRARERAADEGQGPPLWRLETLTRIRATRPMTDVEISSYENLVAYRPGPRLPVAAPRPEPIDFARDLAPPDLAARFPPDPFRKERLAYVETLKLKADRDPLSPKTVTAYIKGVRNLSLGQLGATARADLRGRIKRVLAVLPYNAPLWHELSSLTFEDEPTLEQIDAAGRAADNAFFYSGLLPDELSHSITLRLGQVMRLNARPELKIPAGLDAAALARRDQILNCPLLRDLRLVMAVCPDPAHFTKTCLRLPIGKVELPMGTLMEHLSEAAARSGCKTGEAPINLLLPKGPAEFDLGTE